MSGNSFGKALVLTTFGESHGKAVGGVLDGFPSNIEIDIDFIQSELNRRKPLSAIFSTSREEEDCVEILSGLFENKSTGAPIAFLVYNADQRPIDYEYLKEAYRPSHADFTYQQKYGHRDYRGGGRASARETLARVIGGAFSKILLKRNDITIQSWISQIGPFQMRNPACTSPPNPSPQGEGNIQHPASNFQDTASCILHPASVSLPAEVLDFLDQLKRDGDTAGGIISCSVTGVPAGLGEPVFDKLQADLAKAMLSINTVKGFEYGSGFGSASMKGSEHNDCFVSEKGKIKTLTNFSGGIQGGISNGEEIFFRVAFKPVSSLMKEQETVTTDGTPIRIPAKGRHDVCVVPRALPIVEAMAALVLADHLLRMSYNL
ncbi:MAG: chorismate synthase [Bacteroidales bacterium]|jgi:chorismate synthase|nr:chorismate synthase [Bacteroidales bacterium]